MVKSKYIDSDLLMKKVKEELRRYYRIDLDTLPKKHTAWTEDQRIAYRNVKSNVYNLLRNEAKEKAQDFWLNKMDTGVIKQELRRLGFIFNNYSNTSVVCGEQLKRFLLEHYVNEVVFPKLREKFDLEGIKLKKRATINTTSSIFDFSDAHIAEEKEENKNVE